ncbi:MAG: hypothetical protein ACYTBV_20435, partial [Planctomycetota bacterium]
IQENRCQLLKSRPDALERGSLLIYGNYVPGQNIFFKRHIFDKYKYNTDNKYSMDYELYLDFSEENYLHLYVPEVAVTSIFDGNISNSLRMQQASKSAHIALKYFSVRGTRKLIHILTSSLKLIFNYKKYRKSTDGILFASCMKKIIAKRSRRHIYGAKNS